MKLKLILVAIFLSQLFMLKAQNNEFKIGIFGYSYMSETNHSCSNLSYVPITSITYNGYPSSHGNVLSSDGFNIVINYQPDMYNSSVTFMSGLLDLLKNNNLQYFTNTRYFFKPNINCLGGTNVYNNNGIGNNSNCKARPNYDDLFTNVYSSPDYRNVVWGHQITEEASYEHPYNPTNNFIDWDDPQNCSSEVPPTNVSNAIGYFRQKQNYLGINQQKLVVMEANHHKSIHDNTDDTKGFYNPQDYLKTSNKPDVFLEGSYTQFPSSDWLNQNYSAISSPTGYHYLGPIKSIDYAYSKVNEVHKVINTENTSRVSSYFLHYHSDPSIQNANWLWFQAYTSIIHGAKGIWFWDLDGSYAFCEKADILINNNNGITNATIIAKARAICSSLANFNDIQINCSSSIQIICGTDTLTIGDIYNRAVSQLWNELDERFGNEYFSSAYINFISNLSKELRYLTNINLISTDPKTIIYIKTDHSDNNGIVPPASSYIPTSLPVEKRNENYGLRYTIRTNGQETIIIISNPLNVSISNVTLDLRNVSDPIIRNSTSAEILFETNSSVTSSTYKTNRNSNINLTTNTVGTKYSKSFNGYLSLSFGPMDVHIIRFSAKTGWNEEILVPSSSNTVLEKTDLKFGNGQLFYVREDGIIHAMSKDNLGVWDDNWVNPAAPKMKSGSLFSVGLEVIPENNNEIFYVAHNQRIYRLNWNGSSWDYSSTNSSAYVRRDSELHYGNGQLFYVDTYGRLHALYKIGSSWIYNWLNGNAPKVKAGTGFALIPQENNTLFYVAEDSRIYHIYWNGSQWLFSLTNSSAYVRSDSELHYANGQLFYVDSYGRLHNLYKVGNSWIYNWLNGNAPKVKDGTGFALVPEQNNTIYYIGSDDNIYKMYWTSTDGWLYSRLNQASPNISGGKHSHDLIFAENQVFYVGKNDTRIHRLHYVSMHQDRTVPNSVLFSESFNNTNFASTEMKITEFQDNIINLYPNPVNNILYINLPDDILFTIDLININGKTLMSLRTRNFAEIDCSNINPGIYILRIVSNEEIYQRKVIIKR